MIHATKYTFAVRGPICEFGIWHADRDATECLTGGYSDPVTRAEIEELVANPGCNSLVAWEGLTGWYAESAFDEDGEDVTREFTITLTGHGIVDRQTEARGVDCQHD